MTRIGCLFLGLLVASSGAFWLMVARAPETRPSNSPAAGSTRPLSRSAALSIAQPTTSGLIVPVAGVRPDQLVDSWHDAREDGARQHEALDIPAPRDTPALAAFAGRVDKLFNSSRGGTTIYVRSRDGATMAYYAHLSRYADLIQEGQAVKQGQTIGYVGDTGDAGPGNTHLHFALAHMAPGEKWYQGTPYDPFPLLAGSAPSR